MQTSKLLLAALLLAAAPAVAGNPTYNPVEPLQRLYSVYTQDEHFYTTSQADADAVILLDWADEGIVGYIYTEQVPGSVPL